MRTNSSSVVHLSTDVKNAIMFPQVWLDRVQHELTKGHGLYVTVMPKSRTLVVHLPDDLTTYWVSEFSYI